jgi:hypothetical protein
VYRRLAKWLCNVRMRKAGCRTGSRRHWLRTGPINRKPHGAKENRQTDILGASLPEGHRIIDYHEGTAEVDRIQGAKRQKGRIGGMALRGRHFSTMPVLREWRNARNAGRCRRKSRLMRGASAAGVQQCHVDGSVVVGVGLSSRGAHAGYKLNGARTGLAAGVNTPWAAVNALGRHRGH